MHCFTRSIFLEISHPVCCFHADSSHETSSSSVILFKESTLEKCKKILKLRKDCSLKYANVILPAATNGISGFHMDCYRRFIALPKNARSNVQVKMNDTEKSLNTEKPPMTRSSHGAYPTPSKTTGVFPKACIFCNRLRKKVRGVEHKLISAKTRKFEANIRKFVEWKHDRSLATRINGVHFGVK